MTRSDRNEHLVQLMAEVSQVMKEQHISQAELARRMDTSRANVCKVLKLEVDPRASTLIAMLKALDRVLTTTPTPSQQPVGE